VGQGKQHVSEKKRQKKSDGVWEKSPVWFAIDPVTAAMWARRKSSGWCWAGGGTAGGPGWGRGLATGHTTKIAPPPRKARTPRQLGITGGEGGPGGEAAAEEDDEGTAGEEPREEQEHRRVLRRIPRARQKFVRKRFPT